MRIPSVSVCMCVCRSVHGAVLPLGVGIGVRARRVHGHVGGADDDGPALLLLGARPSLLRALDVLDGLQAEGAGRKLVRGPQGAPLR